MTSLKLQCLTTDGTYLYGFSQPSYSGYNTNTDGSAFALIRSNPNPTSAATLTWTLLNAIEASDHIFLTGEQQCTIDDKGVFSVFSPESFEKGHYNSVRPKGIRFTPGGSNPKRDTQGSMSGTWKNFNLTGYEQHCWEAHVTNEVFNHKDSTGVNTLMHAAVNISSYEDILFIRELGSSENTGFAEILTMVPVGASTSFEIFMIPKSATTVINLMDNTQQQALRADRRFWRDRRLSHSNNKYTPRTPCNNSKHILLRMHNHHNYSHISRPSNSLCFRPTHDRLLPQSWTQITRFCSNNHNRNRNPNMTLKRHKT
ncbi:hypothetical protein BG006_007433 [Podila minutissima]|uniref:Uncharacterized protein n=1 Tax=Podila minutissima TaxID=64525 RepID=A0A9P5SRH3_9FUNG|nr:hypothetical protein BG006_007433 [Podila minutissima]